MIGRTSTDNLWVLLGPCVQCNVAQVATGGKKWLENQNLNGMRWSLGHHRIKNGQVMATQRYAKSGHAANLDQLLAILATFFEKWPPTLLCPLLL